MMTELARTVLDAVDRESPLQRMVNQADASTKCKGSRI